MTKDKFTKRIYFFIGTTAELIKLSPVIRELEKRKIEFKIISSGQTKINFNELSFIIKKNKADIAFREKNNKTSTILFFLWTLKTLLQVLALKQEFTGMNRKNSYFIVHGDTISSLIGAIFSKIYRLRLIHIESGLTSTNLTEPFPEELSRRIISRLADVHFCPNEWSMKNLSNTHGLKVNTVQNTLIESTQTILNLDVKPNYPFALNGKKYYVLIVHRQEHVVFGKEESKKLIDFIISSSNKELVCIFVCHVTAVGLLDSINKKSGSNREVITTPRLAYKDFIKLLNNAEYLVTDGGSNQEEAYYMGLPCLLLRKHTERIEGLGSNVVLSKNSRSVIKDFCQNYDSYRNEKIVAKVPPSKIIVDYLLNPL